MLLTAQKISPDTNLMLLTAQKISPDTNFMLLTAQKISPDTKDKVQLQILLHDGGAKTFHFTSRKGKDQAVADRNGVKELLQQLLPQHRQKISSELEDKKKYIQFLYCEMCSL